MEEKDPSLQEQLETSSPEAPLQEEPIKQLSPEERNFAELREQKKRIERERDELRKRMEQIESSQHTAAPSKPSLADDDLVEWKYVKQEIDGLKNEIQKYQQTSTHAAAESRLKARYTDFDKVVTQSNIERLREQYPEIAQTLAANKDLYSQAASAYDIIKRYGIYQDDMYKEDKQRVQDNMNKPKLTPGVSNRSESPLDNAHAFAEGLTPDLKRKLYAEMQEAVKRR